MSAVIKTTTPFVIESVLVAALEMIGAEPIIVTNEQMKTSHHHGGIQLGDILTNRSDYYGPQHFRLVKDRWVLKHDSSEMNGRITTLSTASKQYKQVGEFLELIGKAYERNYQQHLKILAKQERLRLEEERKKRVEAVRQQAIAKARAQGYSVKQTIIGDKVQLILRRTV